MNNGDRLLALDGLRGVAILLVLGFHFCYIYAPSLTGGGSLYPFGDTFAAVPLFKFGFMGVQLFFLISGFVIAFTLDSSSSPADFIKRRFARIWPALIICSVVTFVLLRYSDSPFASAQRHAWYDFFPSLTLTPKEYWSGIFPNARLIDRAYWTLIVEVRFYALAAIVYWCLPVLTFSGRLTIISAIAFGARALLQASLPETGRIVSELFIVDHLPWFAAGAVFYEVYSSKISNRTGLLLAGLTFGMVVKIALRDPNYEAITIISLAFYFSFYLLLVLGAHPLIAPRGLVWIGTISYSIYLLHQPIGLVMISSLPPSLTSSGYVIALLAIVATVFLISAVSYIVVEKIGRRIVLGKKI